jgi:hypothetical protein
MELPPPPHPNLHPQPRVPLDKPSFSSQEISQDLSKILKDPEDNLDRNRVSQRNIELQQTGELLAQVTIGEDNGAERKQQEYIEGQVKDKNKEDLPISFSEGHQPSDEEVDLSAIMKSLQISIPEDIEVGYKGEEIQRPEENSPFRLLMKVASSAGTPRNIPLQALNDAMSRAWGENYWIIDQIKSAVYVAYFRDDNAMDFVLKKQPWSLDSDNLLLEWINPREADRDADDYQFRYIYVPIRVYGVPERFRTPHLMRYVIEKVAQPSDLHPPPEITMTVRKDYIQAYAKMEVHKPVTDKVKYYVSPNEYILFYLNYDKIKRICIFCGVMFHSVQNCPSRRKLIMHLQSIKASTSSVPFSNIGIWTSQATKIPHMAFQQSSILGGLSLEYRRDIKKERSSDTDQCSLSRFKISEDHTDQNKVNRRTGEKYVCPKVHAGPLLALEPPPQVSGHSRARSTWNPQSLQGNAEVQNPSTHTATNNQQISDASIPQKRQKRQAETEAIAIKELSREHGHTRLKSAPPATQYSGMASSISIASELQGVYRPPQLRYGQDTGSTFISQQTHQPLEQKQPFAYKFTEGTSQSPPAIRRKFHPKKNRWDEKRVETKENIVFNSGHSGGICYNYIAKDMQQAQLIAANSEDDANKVHVRDNEDPMDNVEIGNVEGTESSPQNGNQAAAPAFKAPWAQ